MPYSMPTFPILPSSSMALYPGPSGATTLAMRGIRIKEECRVGVPKSSSHKLVRSPSLRITLAVNWGVK